MKIDKEFLEKNLENWIDLGYFVQAFNKREIQGIEAWKPHPSCLGRWDGNKGHLPTEEYLSSAEYQKAYFEGIKTHYLAQI